MPDPATHTSGSLARALTSAGVAVELVGPNDLPLLRFDAAEQAGEGAVTFFRTDRFADQWRQGRASAAIVSRDHAAAYATDAPRRALLVVPNTDLAFIKALALFAPPAPPVRPGVHPSACVDPSATIDPGAEVGPLCVIGPGASVGAGSLLKNSVVLGPLARVGARCTLHPGVRVLDRCRVGDRCILHANAVLGADGFGYRPDGAGLAKVPHIGDVVVEDEVEIGAGSCIDRATLGSTVIGRGSKIDNLVQIAHNCRIGKCCIICGLCGLAGSVTLGDGVVLGGGVGVADGVTIGSGSRLGAQSGVINDVPPGSEWIGSPAGPASDQRRNYAVLRHLAQTIAEIKKKLRAVELR